MKFEKYHGQGNDFIIVDVPSVDAVSPAEAARLCHRHFGVGADGVLLVSPTSEGLARMTVLNADGSRPEMCGNGLRCVARYLAEHRGAPETFDVVTDAGLRRCTVTRREGETWVTISLGHGKPTGQFVLPWQGARLEFDLVSMGNPHAVLFDSPYDVAAVDEIGPTVSKSQPEGSNVEFVRQRGERVLEVIVWERGVGRTMACGTGAGAVVVAAARRGIVPFDVPVEVILPGGSLEVLVEGESLHVRKQGPVKRVYSGELA
jgi:diaminopimelate epimerase